MAFAPGEFTEICRAIWGSRYAEILSEARAINIRTVQRWISGAAEVPAELEAEIRKQHQIVVGVDPVNKIVAVLAQLDARGAWPETIDVQVRIATAWAKMHRIP